MSLTPRAPRLRSTSCSHGFDVDECRHPGDEDNLAMEAAALDQIISAAADSGTDSRLAGVMRGLARRAVAAGHGADGFSRVVGHLRTG